MAERKKVKTASTQRKAMVLNVLLFSEVQNQNFDLVVIVSIRLVFFNLDYLQKDSLLICLY